MCRWFLTSVTSKWKQTRFPKRCTLFETPFRNPAILHVTYWPWGFFGTNHQGGELWQCVNFECDFMIRIVFQKRDYSEETSVLSVLFFFLVNSEEDIWILLSLNCWMKWLYVSQSEVFGVYKKKRLIFPLLQSAKVVTDIQATRYSRAHVFSLTMHKYVGLWLDTIHRTYTYRHSALWNFIENMYIQCNYIWTLASCHGHKNYCGLLITLYLLLGYLIHFVGKCLYPDFLTQKKFICITRLLKNNYFGLNGYLFIVGCPTGNNTFQEHFWIWYTVSGTQYLDATLGIISGTG
jgi:hypothetical protein